jgi:hypothetical protein
MHDGKRVNLQSLKEFSRKLGRHSALREALLHERDEVSPVEFLAKLEVWLSLLRYSEKGDLLA